MIRPMKAVVKNVEKTICCVHWKEFPPPAALVAAFEQVTLDALWKSGKVEATEYHRAKIWEKQCGKRKMDDACTGCTHVRTPEIRENLPVLATLDGLHAVPVVDIPTLDILSHRRRVVVGQGPKTK